MCGICGFTGNIHKDKTEQIIKNMSEKIKHRGPDGEGYYIDDNIALGFRRLSFLDLSEGNQPMFNEDKTKVIVFNGEIYNYKKLREELVAAGHIFATGADTEVILHGYEQYGEAIVDKLRGMFAFAIYDTQTGSVFCGRDPFGIKPFYYAVINDSFVFASEIKAILEYPSFHKSVNLDALTNYLTFQYSVLPQTFFDGVFKLMPGHTLVFENGKISTKKYFDVTFAPKDQDLSIITSRIDSVLKDSIDHHNVSDVEIGSFLSSGVDSSMIATRFGGKKTFTVGFDYEEYNEIGYAQQLSQEKGLTNHSKVITTEEYWDNIQNIQYHMDEPLADPSAIALYFVSDIAKDHVKGVMSGEGADEFFGGYNIYKEPLSLAPIQIVSSKILSAVAKILSFLPNFKGKNYVTRAATPIDQRFIGNAKMFSEKERNKILKRTGETTILDVTDPLYSQARKYDDITKMQFIDIHLWLVGDILLKADKMSMAHSLEVRVPYLDKEVFNVARTIPTKHRVNKKETKIAFRRVAENYLPHRVSSKKKLGFPVPVRVWLREEKYYNLVKTAFESHASNQFFNTNHLVELLDDHKSGKKDNSRKIWTIYMFLVWYDRFFKDMV